MHGGQRTCRSVKSRRKERELFFWTVRQILDLIALATLVAYLALSLIEGRYAAELLQLLHRSM